MAIKEVTPQQAHDILTNGLTLFISMFVPKASLSTAIRTY